MKRFGAVAIVIMITIFICACGGAPETMIPSPSEAPSHSLSNNPSLSETPSASPSVTAYEENVMQFKGGTMNLINKVVAEASLQECYVNPEIRLYGYIYNSENEELYVYFKYTNPFDEFKLAGLWTLDFTIITVEGQKVNGSIDKGFVVFSAYGSTLRCFNASGITAKPSQIIIDDMEMTLNGTQTLELESVELPSNSIYPNYDVSPVFRELSKKSERLQDLAWIEKAVIDEVSYSEGGIKMTMTITPSKYISSGLFRDLDPLEFALISNKNEAITAWLVDGVESYEQLPANVPFTFNIFFKPMTINSETFQFYINNQYTIYKTVGPNEYFMYDALSAGGFNIRDGSISEYISNASNETNSTIPKDPTESDNRPIFTYAKASSTLPSEGKYTYDAANVLDGDISTCWSENETGLGIGEWIEISSDELQIVNGIHLDNGYQIDQHNWESNGYVTSLKLEFSDGSYEVYENIDSVSQDLDFETRTTSYIKITIVDANEGSKFSDVCISEILVY